MATVIVALLVIGVCGGLVVFFMKSSVLGDRVSGAGGEAITVEGAEDTGADKAIHEAIKRLDVPPNKATQAAQALSDFVDKEANKRIVQERQKITFEYEKKLNDKDTQVAQVNEKYQMADRKYKQSNKEKKQIEAIVRSLGEGLIVVNKKGEPMMMNPAAEQMLNVKKSDLKGKSILDHKTDTQVVSMFGNIDEEGESEIQITGKSETKKVLHQSRAVIQSEDGETMGMVSVLTDVTRQKELETMKEQFVASVTHELRTPLHCINESVNLLLERIAGDVSPKQEKLLTVARRNIKRLTGLINDLLDVSKLESGEFKLRMGTFKMDELLELIRSTFDSWAVSKNMTIDVKGLGDSVEVDGDHDRLNQVITNLMGNAMKFTPDGGKILLTAKTFDHFGKEWIEVRVKDTGPGLPKEEQIKIFEKFAQAQSLRQTEVKGTGLGLAIAKEIVELHGGEISVESEEGKGSSFFFTIPRHAVKVVEEVEEVEAPTS